MGMSEHGKFGWQALALLGLAFLFSALATHALAAPSDKPPKPPKPPKTPNILFFIMDDVGIDQMKTFGYGGATAPRTPNIDAIAQAGVRFRNTWAMPECSPSRSVVFTGRYPLRTNIQAIIVPNVLANSQVSPFEITTPKLLKTHGAKYESAMFGKFHMAGPENNPFGIGGPHSIGWDFFYGFIEGEPYPIDTFAGITPPSGSSDTGPYACGVVGGANPGVCRFANGACEELTSGRKGLECAAKGGLFDEGGTCGSSPSHDLNFGTPNAYYVSPLVINYPDGAAVQLPYSDPRARGYRTTLEVNAARDWIQQRVSKNPWMATVSFSSAHVPYQPPPPSLIRPGVPDSSDFDCTTDAAVRLLSNQTIEAMDTELGRLLVELGLASRAPNGDLIYDPAATDTMVVILGDNGTYAPVVKAPFDPLHSKGTPYQTGVWVPLIVAGPLVKQPDREVAHMVNVADLYALFGEIAKVDVDKAVPKSHTLDAVSMLPYLTNPSQKSLRTTNFTQGGTSITANNAHGQPCVIPVGTTSQVCVELFPSKEVCGSQGGSWFGDGHVPVAYQSCCEVKNSTEAPAGLLLLPISSRAMRDDRFKLLQKDVANCSVPPVPNDFHTETEFYELNELPVFPLIERLEGGTLPANNLLPAGTDPSTLPPVQRASFFSLQAELQKLLQSETPCPGDGNLDKVVNGEDLANWRYFRSLSGDTSSWYDFPQNGVYDGVTDDADLQIIQQNLGTKCLKGK